MDLKMLLKWYVDKKAQQDSKIKFNSNHYEPIVIQKLIRELVEGNIINPRYQKSLGMFIIKNIKQRNSIEKLFGLCFQFFNQQIGLSIQNYNEMLEYALSLTRFTELQKLWQYLL